MKASSIHTFCAGMTLRIGGVSAGCYASMNLGLHVGDSVDDVCTNRQLIGKALDFSLDRWVCAEQVHGNRIARVDAEMAGAGARSLESAVPGVDGLFTTEPDLLLALCFADCVPIYYGTRNPDAIGIMHAGWRGTVAGGAGHMVRRMCSDLHFPPQSLEVVIGPSIGADVYEVDQQIIDQVQKLGRECWTNAVRETVNGHYLLDLKAVNRSVLIEAGVPEQQIRVSGYSTFAHPELFFSHRRDHGRTGRMMGYIGMKKRRQ
nr:peptidoglycan editing factor PgeF [Sporolactobacillus mangiferae]